MDKFFFEAIATLKFKQIGGNQTEVTMIMEFEPKMGILGKLMVPMMKSKFKGMLNALLAGNEAFVTQGKMVNAVVM